MNKNQNFSLSIQLIRLCLIILLSVVGSATLFAQSIAKIGSKHVSKSLLLTDKIENSLKNSFSNSEKVVWSEKDNCYTTFVNNKVKYKIWYNKNGEVVKTIRSYSEDELSPFMLAKIKHNYEGKSIFLVTEVINVEGIYYYIILEDDKKWYRIKADGSKSLTVVMEYDKS
jgi:hypothetical protein